MNEPIIAAALSGITLALCGVIVLLDRKSGPRP